MYNTSINRTGNIWENNNQTTTTQPSPVGGSLAEGRVNGRVGGTVGGGVKSHDDVSGISFDSDDNNRFLSILGAPYSATDDGHGKFSPAPRTKWPRTDHGTPGDNKNNRD